jgi:hypothetical protein
MTSLTWMVAVDGQAPRLAEAETEDCASEDLSFASDRAVKCSAASYSSVVTSEDDRSTF